MSDDSTTLNRTQDIARQIRATVLPILNADEARRDANTALQDAATQAVSTREGIMVQLAALSMREDWTAAEIVVAASTAAAMSNNKADKSLATFIGETKKAMHPGVRAHVGYLLDLREQVWQAEKASGKDDPRPCAKAFGRAYHMLQSMMELCRDGTLLRDAQHTIEWAVSLDPDMNPEKAIKRLEAIHKQLHAISTRFPIDALLAASAHLASVTKDQLAKAHETVMRTPASTSGKTPLAPLAPIPPHIAQAVAAARTAAPAKPAAPAPAPERDDVDAIDAALDDMVPFMAAA